MLVAAELVGFDDKRVAIAIHRNHVARHAQRTAIVRASGDGGADDKNVLQAQPEQNFGAGHLGISLPVAQFGRSDDDGIDIGRGQAAVGKGLARRQYGLLGDADMRYRHALMAVLPEFFQQRGIVSQARQRVDRDQLIVVLSESADSDGRLGIGCRRHGQLMHIPRLSPGPAQSVPGVLTEAPV
jgi:hypothetical protein